MRVLYLQLPVAEFGYDYAGADHPLAGGYMAAHALARGVEHEPLFLPPSLTSFASTPALLKHILLMEPHVVAATLYLWNVDRTISLGLALKAARAEIRLLAGGPEAAGDFDQRFPGQPFEWVHPGEGEEVFSRVLGELSRDLSTSAQRLVHAASQATGLARLDQIPSPYLQGILPRAPDGSIWVETMRGCPFGCAYCYYGKAFGRMRWFPAQWLREHVAWASARGAREIYLLDPSFQVTPGLRQRLEQLASWNHVPVALHTEARVDRMSPDLAGAFHRAGFRSLETGLQSIHPEVLGKVGRSGDAHRFVRGAQLLLERGIQLQIDVILGLPGDTPQGFLETVDFLAEHGLGKHVTVFPLLVLPGTRLREKARSWQVLYRSIPPYQVEAVGEAGQEDLRRAMEEAERRLDLGLYPLHLPDLSPQEGPHELIGLVEIRQKSQKIPPGLPRHLMESLSQSPVFLFRCDGQEPPWAHIAGWARWQKQTVPDLLPFWGLEARGRFSIRALEELLVQLHDPESYQTGLWSLCPEPYLRLSCRPFVLSQCKGDPDFWLDVNQVLPVVRISPGVPMSLDGEPLGKLPVLWDTTSLLSRKILEAVRPGFQGREEELLFSRWENAVSWARITGLPLPPGRPRMGRVLLP
jgi:hypothetical protein